MGEVTSRSVTSRGTRDMVRGLAYYLVDRDGRTGDVKAVNMDAVLEMPAWLSSEFQESVAGGQLLVHARPRPRSRCVRQRRKGRSLVGVIQRGRRMTWQFLKYRMRNLARLLCYSIILRGIVF